MMKKKFCTGKVGKVSFLGAALFSAMCMFSVTVFAGPGDDDDDIGGSTTGTPEPSFHQLSMQLSLNGVPVNLTPDMQTAIQAIINANLPQQETPSAMSSVTPNVTPQMLNFNDNDDSLDDLFFDDSDYTAFESLCDAQNTALPADTDVNPSQLDSDDNHDAPDNSVAIQQPAHRMHGDQWDSCKPWKAKYVVLELGKFLQYSRLMYPDRKARVLNLASAYLSCPELRVPAKDSNNSSYIHEKLCQNPELLQKLQILIGNTDFKNYASQYKDKSLPRVKSNNVLTEAGKTLRHDLWHFAWRADLLPVTVTKDNINKELAMKICGFVLQMNGIEHRFTRAEMRAKPVLLNNMAANYRGAFDAFFRDPALIANCAQWCKDNGYVQKSRGPKF